jgi:site-specific DNA-cytosine methylase
MKHTVVTRSSFWLPTIAFMKTKEAEGPQAINSHVTRTLSPDNLRRLRQAKPGAVWKSLPEQMRPKCHRDGYHGFTNVYGRMRWDEPSVTITAGLRVAHPKVAGSNPAPATKESIIYGNPVLPTDSQYLPIRKIMVQALAFTGLSTISTTFPFASLFDDDIACP